LRDGKIPFKAMHQVITRKGCRFSCGWLPPTVETVAGFIAPGLPGEAKALTP
jgi:hypothetical protein